ncbi:MAG TPA: NAD-dependent dehydratase, partial [Cupriavidus sp.]|nr:NAD-dependent dehydratase [Cupriavidus sp.]
PMLRIVMALVWLATALVTLFAYPLADSLALLGAVGLHGTPAIVTLYAAVFVDAAMAVGCLRYPSRRLWALQAALVAGYSLIIAVALPEFLWHPFGPVLKNLSILAILFILYAEQESWNTSPSR